MIKGVKSRVKKISFFVGVLELSTWYIETIAHLIPAEKILSFLVKIPLLLQLALLELASAPREIFLQKI